MSAVTSLTHRIARWTYNNSLRRVAPSNFRVMNGVAVRRNGALDRLVVDEDYKESAASWLREQLSPGEVVVDVGGGFGVLAVIAAREGASVITYEPGDDRVEILRDTVRVNRVEHAVDVNHAAVGTVHDAAGETAGAEHLHPANLSPCDVLNLDCEGSELSVLRGLEIRPRHVLVETHPPVATDADVVEALRAIDYEVVERREMPSPDKHLLVARRAAR